MTATWEPWIATSGRDRVLLAVAWWSGAAVGGLLGGSIGGVAGDPRIGAIASAVVVALLQASLLGPAVRSGVPWFCISALAGTLGMLLAVVGGLALQEAAQAAPEQIPQGLAAWAALSGAGGLILAAAQAPLVGGRGVAAGWTVLGAVAGAFLWPIGLAVGRRFGPDLAEAAASVGLIPEGEESAVPIVAASCLAAAWLLHAIPFGLLYASPAVRR
jgi:hypothetical protein